MRISDWSSDVCSSDLGGSGDQRAVVPALARPSARRRALGPCGPTPGAAVRSAGQRSGDLADAGSVPRELRGLHGEALSRAAGEAARLQAGLHGDQGAPAAGGAGAAGAEALEIGRATV